MERSILMGKKMNDSTIKNLHKKYSFLNEEDLNNVVEIVLDRINRENFKTEEEFLNKMTLEIDNKVKNYTKEKIEKQYDFRFISNILYTTPNTSNVDDTFNKIVKFFKAIRLELSFDLSEKMLSNCTILNENVKSVVQKNRTLLKEKFVDEIFDEPNACVLITTYCNLNGIPLKEFEIEIDDDFLKEESLKSGNSLSIFLKEIGSYPLLTAEEEKELGYRILDGDEEAKKTLVECNLRLVVSMAKKVQNRGLPLEDLVQYGMIGLMNAVDKFDVTKGNRFTTMAYWWIKQSIYRSLYDYGSMIRTPTYIQEKKNKIIAAYAILSDELFREPNNEELSEYTGIPASEIEDIMRSVINPISLNVTYSDDNTTEIGDLIASEDDTPEEEFMQSNLHDIIEEILKEVLPEYRERKIIIERFGLDDDTPKTLEQVGKKFGVSRERIRQLEKKAMRKLRIHARSNKKIKALAEYMDNYDGCMSNIYQTLGINKKDKKKEEKTMNNKFELQSIYAMFRSYDKETVKNAVENLLKNDKDFIYKFFGEDLKKICYNTDMNESENIKFLGEIVPKIQRQLDRLEKQKNKILSTREIKNTEVSTETGILSDEEKGKIGRDLSVEFRNIETDRLMDILIDDYGLGCTECDIYLMYCGYVGDRDFYSVKEIMDYFNINEENFKNAYWEIRSKLFGIHSEPYKVLLFIDKLRSLNSDEKTYALFRRLQNCGLVVKESEIYLMYSGFIEDKVYSIEEIASKFDLKPKDVLDIILTSKEKILSKDEELNHILENNKVLLEFQPEVSSIEDENTIIIKESIDKLDLDEKTNSILERLQKCGLNSTECKIYLMRGGFIGSKPYNSKDITKIFNIDEEELKNMYKKCDFKIFINDKGLYTEIYQNKANLMNQKSTNNLNVTEEEIVMKEENSEAKIIKNGGRKLKSIYELLDGNSVEIDYMINELLTDEERHALYRRYGKDLNNPETSKDYTVVEREKFYGTLLPHMKILLKRAKTVLNSENNLDETFSKIEQKEQEDLIKNPQYFKNEEKTVEKIYAEEIKVLKNSLVSESPELENLNFESTEEDGVTMPLNSEKEQELINENTSNFIHTTSNDEALIRKEEASMINIRTSELDAIIEKLSHQKATIVMLKLGYINGKCHKTSEISAFLGVTEEEIVEITKEVLNEYKQVCIRKIDETFNEISLR